MKCFMIVKKLRENAAYYSIKDFDEKVGGEFTLFITPFEGYEEPFYYVRKTDDGIEIEGEGYIVTNKDSLKRHKQDAKQELVDYELKGKTVMYYWRDEDGNVTDRSTK